MKKLLVLILLLLPLYAVSQWSITSSVALGSSKFRINNNEEILKAKLGVECELNVRYIFSSIYISSGVGYNQYSSSNEFYIFDENFELAGRASIADKYKSVFIPVKVGFYLPHKKLSPIAEVGATILFPLYVEHRWNNKLDVRSVNFAAVAAIGARYSFGKNAFELKIQYTKLNNLFSHSDVYSYWSSLGASLTYVVML